MCFQQNSTRFGADLLGDSQNLGVSSCRHPRLSGLGSPAHTPRLPLRLSFQAIPARPFTSLQINMEILAVLILAVLILACATRNRSDHNPQIDPFFFSHDKDSMDDE